MAKRSKSKKRERIPVVDTLIDLAAAATMDIVLSKHRKKSGKKGRKIDPYAATGIAMGMGQLKDTEDLLQLGGFLGAMGAFDDDNEPDIPSYPNLTPRRNNNRYAWRLNCEDGSKYGVHPEDYETRDEYHAAIHKEKATSGAEGCDEEAAEDLVFDEAVSEDTVPSGFCTLASSSSVLPQQSRFTEDPFADDDFHVFIFCKVQPENDEISRYYRTEDRTLKKGDAVKVPSYQSQRIIRGTILSVEHHMRFSVPSPVKETLEIIGRA